MAVPGTRDLEPPLALFIAVVHNPTPTIQRSQSHVESFTQAGREPGSNRAPVALVQRRHLVRRCSTGCATQFSTDPRECSSWQYVNGVRAYNVFGAICSKWYSLAGSLGFLGDARSSEQNALCTFGGKRTDFQGGYIFWGPSPLVAHEVHVHVHGVIAATYANGRFDCMSVAGLPIGAPISDEENSTTPCPLFHQGRRNRFQHGTIEWCPGWTVGRVHPLAGAASPTRTPSTSLVRMVGEGEALPAHGPTISDRSNTISLIRSPSFASAPCKFAATRSWIVSPGMRSSLCSEMLLPSSDAETLPLRAL
jgi:hypothetical protein